MFQRKAYSSPGLLGTLAWIAAGICLLPMAAVALAAATGGGETVSRLADTVLWRYTGATLWLIVLVGLGTGIIGTGAAWLVTATRFPGRRILEVALALPLAFPAYVLAYAYTDFLDHPGIVQTTLRDLTGWGPRDYWFPEIRSLGGAAAMLTLVLYPYVYLLARAAFLQQSATAYIAARTLGQGAWQAFFRVSLPIARPSIAGGVLLALMETLADYGTVSYFGVQTFATGIYQSWFSFFDRGAAAQLALCLLVVALTLATFERAQRRHQRHHGAGRRFETMQPVQLGGIRAAGALAFCLFPVALGFVLPVILLVSMAWDSGQLLFTERYLGFLRNSLVLASIAAVVTVAAAIVLGFNARLRPSRASALAMRVAGLGYAVPGGVIAVGLLVPFAAFDNALDAFMEARFGIDTGLLITGSIWLLVAAYMVRFMAAALSAYDAGLSTINPNIDAVARTLGRTPRSMLRGVHLPILRPSILTALLIVFVDVMKELPATLIMRPFNFDTLAVQAHRLAADERLAQAAVPSLVIAAVGLLPVAVLCWGLGRETRTGRRFIPEPAQNVSAAE
ncbi:Ferric iron ABC transporter, permease protein [Roseibacterium elongatum DSM 19469]|uniref:Ferric iron ABC transporter, permease protein n=1 Tax=Roseicyclus elongatus DSM 19469 TaxID=1294273 RepID=W8SM47_9RHOB|nr:iron ABC transporter permease [Roseibacterium elongatum]AHM03615.1 Ferric iron ABC transporter, permease protein [Roseibacterium elongatum DSM 19469]